VGSLWGSDPPRDLGPGGCGMAQPGAAMERQELAWERRRRGAAEQAVETRLS